MAVLKRYLDSGGDPEKKDEEYGAAPVHWAALVSLSLVCFLLLLVVGFISVFFQGGLPLFIVEIHASLFLGVNRDENHVSISREAAWFSSSPARLPACLS